MVEVFQNLLYELEGQRLIICKIPTTRGSYIRVVVSTNAFWYQRFCADYMSTRKRHPRPRTFIKRRETIAALKRMIHGDRTTEYAQRILRYCYENRVDFGFE